MYSLYRYGPLREAAKKQKVVLKEMLKQISQTSEGKTEITITSHHIPIELDTCALSAALLGLHMSVERLMNALKTNFRGEFMIFWWQISPLKALKEKHCPPEKILQI